MDGHLYKAARISVIYLIKVRLPPPRVSPNHPLLSAHSLRHKAWCQRGVCETIPRDDNAYPTYECQRCFLGNLSIATPSPLPPPPGCTLFSPRCHPPSTYSRKPHIFGCARMKTRCPRLIIAISDEIFSQPPSRTPSPRRAAASQPSIRLYRVL